MQSFSFRAPCWYVLVAIFSLVSLPTSAFTAPEIRAVWINADALPTSEESAAVLIDKYARANINVIFPEVICRGYAVYESPLIGRDPRFAGKPDPLALLIEQAHKSDIEVHPWVWTFRAGYTKDRGWILNTHPDWVEIDKFGDDLSGNGGLWISPAVPDARKYLLDVFSELVHKYSVDGLHLDYVRYESQTPIPYGYNPQSVALFMESYKLDPYNLDRLNSKWMDWRMFREQLVNTFVQNVSSEIRNIKPGIIVSAAVPPDISEARTTFLQNWRHWVNNRWVDFIVPMAYFSDNAKFQNRMKLALNAVQNQTIVVSGLGLHLMKANPELLVEQTVLGREEGDFGQALFASSYLTDNFLDLMTAGPYSKKALLPFRDQQNNALKLAVNAVNAPDSPASKKSQNYMSYLEYQTKKLQFVPPMRPASTLPSIILPVPTVVASKAMQSITIDGKLDEDDWESATPVDIMYTAQGDPYTNPTQVRVLWDEKTLYVAFTVINSEGLNLVTTVTKHDGPVFYDDSVEVFIDPQRTMRSYYHLSTNSVGVKFEQYINKSMDVSWNGEWQCSTTVTEDTWTTEIAIPFASLKTIAPNLGDKWSVNFTRNTFQDSKPIYLNWSIVYGSFHSPDRFGTICFDL